MHTHGVGRQEDLLVTFNALDEGIKVSDLSLSLSSLTFSSMLFEVLLLIAGLPD